MWPLQCRRQWQRSWQRSWVAVMEIMPIDQRDREDGEDLRREGGSSRR
ncbi:hypothetical protein Tco_0555076, partial [Tanacetum coccineum]